MHETSIVTNVVGIIALLFVGAVAAMLLRRLKLPFTVGLVIIGLLIGFLAEEVPGLETLTTIELSPEIILFIFLPTLIFESAFSMDSRLLSRNLGPVLALAVPGLLISTAVVGLIVALFTSLSLPAALLFGALISATDPVAVIALFRGVGAPKRLTVLVEGESLFNDATAIVLFQIILLVALGGVITTGTVLNGALDFVVVFAGGFLVGAVIGYLMIRIIAFANDDPLIEVALSTVVAYAAFIVADHYLHVSGVMATVGAGVIVGTLGSTRFTREVREYLHQFWMYAAFVANSLIFLLVGMSVDARSVLHNAGAIGWAVVAALIGRGITVFVALPLSNRMMSFERIDWKPRIVMFWGGLRGAVALALALSISTAFPGRDLIITLAVGVVLFTLLTGGLTMAPLIHWLKLDEPTLASKLARAQGAVVAKREALARIDEATDTGVVSAGVTRDLKASYRNELERASATLASLRSQCCRREVLAVLFQQAMTLERTAYIEMFDRGRISALALRELELALDLERDELKKEESLPERLPATAPVEVRLEGFFVALLKRIAPRHRFIRKHKLKRIATGYEHDAAVLAASKAVLEELDRLSDLTGADEELTVECRRVYLDRADAALERIDSTAEHFPEFAEAVQRRMIQLTALDGEADAIEHMAAAGGIPESSAREARLRVRTEQHRLASPPVSTLEPRPRELLERVPFFKNLSTSDFQKVAARLVSRPVLAEEVIVREGERGSSLYLVARGVFAVYATVAGGGARRVASLHCGEFLGEMALLTDEPRTATVIASTDGHLYELSRADVNELCGVCVDLRDTLEQAAAKRKVDLLEKTNPGSSPIDID